VLNHDFFVYYNEDSVQLAKEEKQGYGKKAELNILMEELKACRKQIAELEKKYELLEKVNKLTEEKLGKMKRKPKK
jgi:hypothetical protein